MQVLQPPPPLLLPTPPNVVSQSKLRDWAAELQALASILQ